MKRDMRWKLFIDIDTIYRVGRKKINKGGNGKVEYE